MCPVQNVTYVSGQASLEETARASPLEKSRKPGLLGCVFMIFTAERR